MVLRDEMVQSESEWSMNFLGVQRSCARDPSPRWRKHGGLRDDKWDGVRRLWKQIPTRILAGVRLRMARNDDVVRAMAIAGEM